MNKYNLYAECMFLSLVFAFLFVNYLFHSQIFFIYHVLCSNSSQNKMCTVIAKEKRYQ